MNYSTSLFNIVGAAYIPERHLQDDGNHGERLNRRYGPGVPWLDRDLDIAEADAIRKGSSGF